MITLRNPGVSFEQILSYFTLLIYTQIHTTWANVILQAHGSKVKAFNDTIILYHLISVVIRLRRAPLFFRDTVIQAANTD